MAVGGCDCEPADFPDHWRLGSWSALKQRGKIEFKEVRLGRAKRSPIALQTIACHYGAMPCVAIESIEFEQVHRGNVPAHVFPEDSVSEPPCLGHELGL